MVSRCEVDMVQIKKRFYKNYHKTLVSFIKVLATVNSWIPEVATSVYPSVLLCTSEMRSLLYSGQISPLRAAVTVLIKIMLYTLVAQS